jgi:tetratricopeptide (TPR) repeat protein
MKGARPSAGGLLVVAAACLLVGPLATRSPLPAAPLFAAEPEREAGAEGAAKGGAGGAAGAPAENADLVARADAAFEQKNYKEARRLYEEARRAGAQDVHLLSRLGLLQSWDGDLRESVENYRRAIEMTPEDFDLCLDLARVLVLKNDLGEAIGVYEGLRTKRPEDPRALLGLARALGAKGRYAAADAIYVEMETRHIEPIQAHVGRGDLLAWQGDYEKAAHMYRDALRAEPGNLEARISQTRVEHWQGLERVAHAQADNIALDHPESREARLLQREIDETLSPRAAGDAARSTDEGSNKVDRATASATWMLEPQTSLRVAYSAYDAEFRCEDAGRCDEVAASPTPNQVVSTRAQFLTAGLNSRLLNPLYFFARLGALRQDSFDGDSRVLGTLGGSLRWQVGPRLSLSTWGGREPLLDTAVLIDRGLNAFTADVGLEYRLTPFWTVTGSAGYATYSDRNARKSAAAAIEWRLAVAHPRITARLEARYRAFNEEKDNGYFDPLRFDSELLTVAAGDDYRHGRMFWRAEGTIGRQGFDTAPGTNVDGIDHRRVETFYGSFGVGMGATNRASLEAFYAHSDYALNLATGFTSTRSGMSFRYRF